MYNFFQAKGYTGKVGNFRCRWWVLDTALFYIFSGTGYDGISSIGPGKVIDQPDHKALTITLFFTYSIFRCAILSASHLDQHTIAHTLLAAS